MEAGFEIYIIFLVYCSTRSIQLTFLLTALFVLSVQLVLIGSWSSRGFFLFRRWWLVAGRFLVYPIINICFITNFRSGVIGIHVSRLRLLWFLGGSNDYFLGGFLCVTIQEDSFFIYQWGKLNFFLSLDRVGLPSLRLCAVHG